MAISVFHTTSFMWVRERPVEINWNSLKKQQQGKQENEAKEPEKDIQITKKPAFRKKNISEIELFILS